MEKKGFGKLVLGVLVGTGIGIMVAPKKGKDTRRDLKKKMQELLDEAKDMSYEDAKELIDNKIEEIRCDLNDLDKEKVLKIAQEKSDKIKDKLEDLVKLAKKKGTPILEKTVYEVRDKTIDVMKDMIKKLEKIEIETKDNK